VDDNATAREILTEQLSALGLAASAVACGEDALRAVADAKNDHPFDAVFLDWHMPGLDGFETARRLRDMSNLRIIIVTALGRDDVRQRAGQLGVDGFLVKPVSPSSLLDMLVSLFGPQPGAEVIAPDPSTAPAALQGARVLVAEDNEVNRQIACELLQSAGISVEVVEDGQQALDALLSQREHRFDAVLMDIQMPRMDGLEATRRLLGEPGFDCPPIIAMTAHAFAEERERCTSAGMVDHIAKPIDPQALYRTLERWIAGASFKPAPPPAEAVPLTLPQLPGLDVQDGLRRVAGNQELYADLLRKFARHERGAGPRLRELVDANRRDEARSSAHRIKGAAGNLGLKALHAVAAELEAALAHGNAAASELDAFESAAAVLERLEAALAARAVPAPRPLSSDPDAPMRLRKLLLAADAEAVAYFEMHSDALAHTLGTVAHGALRSALDGFDFDAAQRALGQAMDERRHGETREKAA